MKIYFPITSLLAISLAAPVLAQIGGVAPLDDQESAVAEAGPQELLLEQSDGSEGASDPSGKEDENLNLMCFGGGSANKSTVAQAYGSDNYGGSASATVYGTRSQGFEDQVSLRLLGAEGRLRMPRSMLPAIRGGKDGWFKLKKIQYKPNEITASVAVSLLNNPKLRLDRYSGAISISGKSGDFSGQCQKFDPERMKRKF